jgi:hypothetical protein
MGCDTVKSYNLTRFSIIPFEIQQKFYIQLLLKITFIGVVHQYNLLHISLITYRPSNLIHLITRTCLIIMRHIMSSKLQLHTMYQG